MASGFLSLKLCRVPVSSMCSVALFQGGAVCEGLPTVPTLACVDLLVLSEVSALLEGFPTIYTLVWLFPSVSSHADSGMTEGLPPLIAGVGLFLSVNPKVLYERGALAEGSATLITLIGLLSCVGPLM